ncbi:acyl-CoA dehydrogenase family protein [Niabella soli]|uniref:Acyl-CoA dehydrogenase n=1 Tax=Niabella soli DSM 19437 TaxID=929713 RepID=W0F4K5_9BACT|nr:Acyl-CoA dehydrogenase type 2 domain protein [Niabella soli]AHF16394.1 acyl-CoA dehydrogenase [Niabella soli DSM 19437]
MINEQTAKELAALAQLSDEQGVLLPEQLVIIHKERWFKLFVPKTQGGLELGLPEGLAMEEALARIDGSLGWTVTLCAGASLFTGYLPQQLTDRLFEDPAVCFGGSGALSGIAKEVPDGYQVSGSWKYATGTPYSTCFTANCKIERAGQVLMDDAGAPVYRSFIFKREEVTVKNDWNAMGLKATASNSFNVDGLTVSPDRSFMIDPGATTLPGAIFKYPFLQFAEATLAVNTFGMAQHFLEEFDKLLQHKITSGSFAAGQEVLMQTRQTMAANHLQKLRARFYTAIEESWLIVVKGGKIPQALLEHITQLSRGLAKSSRELVGDLYPYCGVGATQNGTTLNRIFRDVFTASQHLLLNL